MEIVLMLGGPKTDFYSISDLLKRSIRLLVSVVKVSRRFTAFDCNFADVAFS